MGVQLARERGGLPLALQQLGLGGRSVSEASCVLFSSRGCSESLVFAAFGLQPLAGCVGCSRSIELDAPSGASCGLAVAQSICASCQGRNPSAVALAIAGWVVQKMAEQAAQAAPETDHPAADAAAAQEPPDVARSAAKKLVSGAISAAKASALDDTLVASLRICTLDGVATTDGDADGVLTKLAALSVSAALFVTVDGEEKRIASEEALFAALRAAASARAIAFRTEARPAKRWRDDDDSDDAADATKRRRHFLNVSSSGIVVASPGVFEAAAAGEGVAVKVFNEDSDVHVGTTCGHCKASPIRGVRYTRPAPGGADLDLCEPCLLAYRTGPARGERRLPFKRVPHPVREVAL